MATQQNLVKTALGATTLRRSRIPEEPNGIGPSWSKSIQVLGF